MVPCLGVQVIVVIRGAAAVDGRELHVQVMVGVHIIEGDAVLPVGPVAVHIPVAAPVIAVVPVIMPVIAPGIVAIIPLGPIDPPAILAAIAIPVVVIAQAVVVDQQAVHIDCRDLIALVGIEPEGHVVAFLDINRPAFTGDRAVLTGLGVDGVVEGIGLGANHSDHNRSVQHPLTGNNRQSCNDHFLACQFMYVFDFIQIVICINVSLTIHINDSSFITGRTHCQCTRKNIKIDFTMICTRYSNHFIKDDT